MFTVLLQVNKQYLKDTLHSSQVSGTLDRWSYYKCCRYPSLSGVVYTAQWFLYPGGGGGGGRLGINHARMCVSKSEGYGSFFVNEMNEKMSFKMGVKFAVPV